MSGAGIAGVVLAAGTSSRLGTPKQLLPVGGAPLVAHTVGLCVDAGFEEIVVVLGYQAARVRAALGGGTGVRVVVNDDFAAGQSTSLRAGLLALGLQARAAALFLGDQPGLARQSLDAVLDTFIGGDYDVVRPRFRGGVPGHPVIAARRVWPRLMEATGDRGAGPVLESGDISVLHVELDVEAPRDVDTWEDYEAVKKGW